MARLTSRRVDPSSSWPTARRKLAPADTRPDATPAALGYRMPGEWEPHEPTWLAWPHERTDWPGKFAPIPWVYADIVRHLARVERVRVLVQDRAEERAARRILQKSGADLAAVDFFVAPTNRGWTAISVRFLYNKCAGSAPPKDVILSEAKNLSEVTNVDREILRRCAPQNDSGGSVGATKWRFNAWAKYDDWKKDNAAMNGVLPKLKIPLWEPQYRGRPVVLEGGSIDGNGAGLLLTTEECLLSPQQARNPGMSRREKTLRAYLGADRALAAQRHRRRRYARPRGRPGALRQSTPW